MKRDIRTADLAPSRERCGRHPGGMGIVLAVGVCTVLAACGKVAPTPPEMAGDVEGGRLLLRQYGCGTCHSIPGVAAARGNTGPPLAGVAKRVYLGGMLPNTPDNMTRWIRAPRDVDPRTAMPDMQVPEAHARDMVAYLYTLR